jgi:hypothetical protein
VVAVSPWEKKNCLQRNRGFHKIFKPVERQGTENVKGTFQNGIADSRNPSSESMGRVLFTRRHYWFKQIVQP